MSLKKKEKNPSRFVGYIQLHRRIQEHWIWADGNKLKWWLDILMECNHSDQKVNIGLRLIDCRRGQSLNSLKTWSGRWRVHVGVVRRFFDLLQKDQMIRIENLRNTTRITVCNYDDYNGERISNESQTNLGFKREVENGLKNEQPLVAHDDQKSAQVNSSESEGYNGERISNESQMNLERISSESRADTNNNELIMIKNDKKEEPFLWENEKKKFLDDGPWIYKFCTTKRITVEVFNQKAKQFLTDLELKEDFKNIKEIRSHFTNWFNKDSPRPVKNGYQTSVSSAPPLKRLH